MKVSISFPPLASVKGTPLLSQNRQFQWFHSPTYIYPMVPAYAASLLKSKGHEVMWDDGIAEALNYQQWKERILRERPDIVAIETKTPVVKQHWKIISDLKKASLEISNWKLVIILMGDHVTALPKESFENSQVDYVLTGGDYDFLLLNLAEHLGDGRALEPGIYWRAPDGTVHNSGSFRLDHNLMELPLIDRQLTRWRLYAEKNGNFKYLPGTYTMVGRDCWWRRDGGCSFCSWTTLYPTFRTATPARLLDEIEQCVALGIKEVFDDTGTFPTGEWLREFCEGMIARGFHKKIRFGCNMRVNALTQEEYALMGRAGFRFILYGLESATQRTLDRIGKGIVVGDITRAVRMAKEAGCEPHVTCMVGYPWELREEAEATVALARDFFHKGWIDSLQATIVIPYPGTRLFRECQEHGWLLTDNWEEYDMRRPIMRSPIPDDAMFALTRGTYTAFLRPQFIIRKALGIRSMNDLRFLLRAAKKLVGHLLDFSKT